MLTVKELAEFLVSADKLGRPDLLEAFEVPDTAAARILRLKLIDQH
jgi:hypothetical protein